MKTAPIEEKELKSAHHLTVASAHESDILINKTGKNPIGGLQRTKEKKLVLDLEGKAIVYTADSFENECSITLTHNTTQEKKK